jgi:hypothetical protein
VLPGRVGHQAPSTATVSAVRAEPVWPGLSADVSPCAILSIPFVLVWIVQTGYPGQPRLHIEFE